MRFAWIAAAVLLLMRLAVPSVEAAPATFLKRTRRPLYRLLEQRMRTALLFLVMLTVSTVATSTDLLAGPLELTRSRQVQMIDGNGDKDSSVNVLISAGAGFDFGFWNVQTDSFETIASAGSSFDTVSFEGGDIIDFAIRDASKGTTTRLSEGTATMVFAGDVAAINSESPVVDFDFWQSLTITWSTGNNDMVVNIGYGTDGFAPVPEPGTMLLGAGGAAFCFALRRRRARKS